MTVAAELAKTNQTMEYILAIEGIGWPANDLSGSLSGGFLGDAWVTNDFNGTLAADLGATIHKGLILGGSLSESIDPRNGDYKPSGLSARIVDTDDWWLTNYTPRAAGVSTTLNTKLEYNATSVVLADGASFATGALAWIGGRELVKLGTKSGGGAPHTYTGSTRAYLGTHRGSVLRKPEANVHNVWIVGTSIKSIAQFWHNRRAVLYAHVPGEAVANCVLLWSGKLKNFTNRMGVGVEYDFDFVGDFMGEMGRIYRQRQWTLVSGSSMNTPPEYTTIMDGNFEVETESKKYSSIMRMVFDAPIANADTQENDGTYSMAAAYQYRTEAGGTDGMVSGWDSGTVQALDDATVGDNIVASFVKLKDRLVFLAKQDNTLSNAKKNIVLAEKWSPAGTPSIENPWDFVGSRVSFMLDNWFDSKLLNRFQVDGRVTRHPIDVLLHFLTSMDREMFRADAIAGSTTTVTEFTAGTVGAVDLWAGKALFSVEQSNTKFGAKVIASNTADDITVEQAFSNAAVSGNEFQVRNSIYDTLPIGWGMGIDSGKLDISTFEYIRERYLPGEEVGRFIIGSETQIDILKMLREYILKPYGIGLRFDRSAGKIGAVFLGQAIGDGLIDTYTAVTAADIIDSGDINHSFHSPISEIKITTRDVETRALVEYANVGGQWKSTGISEGDVPVMIEEGKVNLSIRSAELISAFQEDDRSKLEFKAHLDTINTLGPLLARMYGLAALYSIPPPVWTVTLSMSLYLGLGVGDWVSITANDPAFPVNSFTGARGFTAVAGRVISIDLRLTDKPVFTAQIELFFETIPAGLVAPACTVTSKGNDANGDYFVVNTEDFTNDSAEKDAFYFRTGDLIELRTSAGAWKEAEEIKGFGTTFTTGLPDGTDGTRIYVVGTLVEAIAAGDYVTFQTYSDSNTARMDTYAAYATAAGVLAVADDAKQYT